MWIRHIFFVALLSMSALCEDDTEEVAKFQKLFMQKRIEQLSAVKNILKLDESKRKVLLLLEEKGIYSKRMSTHFGLGPDYVGVSVLIFL